MPIHNISIDDETADEITIAVLRQTWEFCQEDIASAKRQLELGTPSTEWWREGVENLRQLRELSESLEGVLGYFTVLDNCEECGGMRGGVKGNENVVDGIVMCDYCSYQQRVDSGEIEEKSVG